MRFLNTLAVVRNLLAAFGVVALILLTFAYINLLQLRHQLDGFDMEALELHKEYLTQLVATGDSAAVTLWKAEVHPELDPGAVDDAVQLVADRENLGPIDQWPATSDFRGPDTAGLVKLYLLREDAATTGRIVGYNDAYAAYLPWRLSLVRDRGGRLWMYTRIWTCSSTAERPCPPMPTTPPCV